MSDVQTPAVVRDGWPLHSIGRRASRAIPYLLPRHPSEIDRLDVQHYAFRAALGGNHAAPVSAPGRVLDVGSGTGQWCYDICADFPEALVVGLDIEAGKPAWPANYRFVQASVLDGLPFDDDSFDFVHQRWMRVSIPLARWPAAVRHLVRVTRPGGLVELAEFRSGLDRGGPATVRLFELLHDLAARRGLDGSGSVPRSLIAYLRHAGAVDIRAGVVSIPIGQWGGETGSIMATDLRAMFTRLAEPFERAFGLDPVACGALVSSALQECESYRTSTLCAHAHGRKP